MSFVTLSLVQPFSLDANGRHTLRIIIAGSLLSLAQAAAAGQVSKPEVIFGRLMEQRLTVLHGDALSSARQSHSRSGWPDSASNDAWCATAVRGAFNDGYRLDDRPPMNTPSLLAFVTVLSTVAGRAESQSGQDPPPARIFVEAFRATDSLSRQAAVQLRTALSARTVPTVLQIVPTDIVDRTKEASRDDSRRPLEWGRVRDFARQLAAQHIVDITVTRDSGMVRILAYVVHPVRTGVPLQMPIVTGRSLDDAVTKLADSLAARNWTIAK